MAQRDPRGSWVHGIGRIQLEWAIKEIVRVLPSDSVAKLKVDSGEHLAALLTTAFIGTPPIRLDTGGGADLQFDVQKRLNPNSRIDDLIGRSDARFADFEVKSLPGKFREYNSALDRALEAGIEPDEPKYVVKVVSANSVVIASKDMISKAWGQLQKKSSSDRSRNIFLIAHFFDYPVVEIAQAPLMAHNLDEPDLPKGVDSLWILFAPHSLVAWSASCRRWMNLIFGPGDVAGDENLDALQHVEMEFLAQIGGPMSPYVFGLTADDVD